MSSRIVEVAFVPAKPGLDLSTGEAKKAWDFAINIIAKQPSAKAVYWGVQVENPDVLQIIIEWDSEDSYKSFSAIPEYQDFKDTLKDHVAAGPTSLFYADLAPNRTSTDPFTMPVTESLSAYLPADYDSATFAKQFVAFEDAAAAVPNVTAKGMLGGWSKEPVKHESLGEGVEGKLFFIFIGWPDLEAHPKFQKTEHYMPTVGHLREGMTARDLVHVQFRKVK